MELLQHPEAVQPREEQVEDDEVPLAGARERQARRPVVGGGHAVSLGLEPPADECLDARLVLDQQDLHRSPFDSNPIEDDV